MMYEVEITKVCFVQAESEGYQSETAPISVGSLSLRLSHGRRADLLEYLQEIQFVPVFDKLPVLDAPDVDAAHLDRCTIGPITHERLAKGSVVSEAGADAIALFDHVIHDNFRVRKCVEVVPKECLNARRAGLYVGVVVVVFRAGKDFFRWARGCCADLADDPRWH